MKEETIRKLTKETYEGYIMGEETKEKGEETRKR
jgi:hypothetical protein